VTASPGAGAAATHAATTDPGLAGPARAVFFGTGAFALPILAALLELPAIRVVGVVTAPDRPAGRGRLLTASPVATAAATRNVAILQPASLRDEAARAAVAALRPTLGVLADYGRIVPAPILDLPAHGFLNVHPSLLPRHRGAAPIAAAILAGDAETGVSIMRMDAGLDTGPLVAVETWPLAGTETSAELERHAAGVGARLLAGVIPAWLAGELPATPQADAEATLTRPLRREDGRLDGSEPARIAERKVRAYDPWPGAFLEIDRGGAARERVAILAATLTESEPDDEAGRLAAAGDGVALTTIDGRLRLRDVRPAGGRAMTSADWLRGRPSLVGARVLGSAAPPAEGRR
jgi:methionyl-tRNA formyltransferase